MSNDDFRRIFFERYAEQDETLDEGWFEAFFEEAFRSGHPAEMDIEWDNETDSGNFASGDESERIFSFSDEELVTYWTQSSFNGVQGPFEKYDEAVEALGYDSASFPPPPPEPEEDGEGAD
jgi:hypothetical protein